LHQESCLNRGESASLNDKTKSLVLVNYFPSIPIKKITCEDSSLDLLNKLQKCYSAAGNWWANFVAVDFYKVKLAFHCRCFPRDHEFSLLFVVMFTVIVVIINDAEE
jgi:hypothetical protein